MKRAQKELDSGEVTCEVSDSGEELVFTWSDGITCWFPAGKAIHDAICSSGTLGISRHVVRSVLAYQRLATAGDAAASTAENDEPTTDVAASGSVGEVWDPGTITDEQLIAQFRKTAISKARTRFEQGVLVELTRGAKPVARFLATCIC